MTAEADALTVVSERIDQLLAKADPYRTPVTEFRGLQFDLGLAWVHFPDGRGGLGLRPSLQDEIDRRLLAAGAPPPGPRLLIALALVGPTVVTHGTESMKDNLLRRMFTGEDAWCQLFSEPGAGSDLAGLATRAVRDGDEWVVNGQKVWSTLAHIADFGMLIARTDPDVPKHKGLTFFALDMRSEGIEVRPLMQITGEAEFNEVYLTDVHVPDTERIGEVGEGWRVTTTTLMNERTTIGGFDALPARGSGAIAEAVRLWREKPGSTALKSRLMELYIQAEVLRLTNIREGQNRAAGNPGPEGSTSKLMNSELNRRIYSFCVDLLGADGTIGYEYPMARSENMAMVGPPGTARMSFLRSLAHTIAGGSSEIQRNIIGERVLGLPGDPRADKDLPWSQVPR